MISEALARRALDAALSTGGDFAELFLEDTPQSLLVLRGGKIEAAQLGRSHGAGVRVFRGTSAYYVYTNDFTEGGLLACARDAAAALSGQPETRVAPFRKLEFEPMHPARISGGTVAGARKVAIMRESDAAAQGEDITQVTVQLMDRARHILVVNSEGVFAEDTQHYLRMNTTAVASNGTENQSGYDAPGAQMGFEAFEGKIDAAASGREAARIARTMLHAPACPAGVMPVLIDNAFGGVIFHEACGHSLEATSVAIGMSEFCGKLGTRVAADCVTAIDDGTLAGEWGSYNFDDEGMPATRLVLIERGILRNYMIDKLNGRRMGMPPTGSARRESYAFAPTSRMRNTFIAAGTDDEDEMLSTMGDGLYARKMGGGSVNPATGEFNFAVAEGYLVRGGKIVSPVRGASLIGKGTEVLAKIDRVGRNMRMAQGMCGSESGGVPVNVGEPMIRVSQLTVGGRA